MRQKLIFTNSVVQIQRLPSTDGMLLQAHDIYIRSIVIPILFQKDASCTSVSIDIKNERIGVSTIAPKSKIHVTDGYVYFDNANNGVILKSPDGKYWRAKVNNTGTLATTNIPCP